jgi:hypothetical protein
MEHFLEAEYESGYIHSEAIQDISPYDPERNIFYDIKNKVPERIHGKMVRLSLVGPELRYDIDWTTLPDNARPIRLIDKEKTWLLGTNEVVGEKFSYRFGYQYNEPDGKNVKEIKQIG